MIKCFPAVDSDCHRSFDNPHLDVNDDAAARAAGWAGFLWPSGMRYICPSCRAPRPRPKDGPAVVNSSVTQLDMFLM
jgi:hypothetical protein